MVFTTIDPSLTPSVQVNILDNAGFEIWQRGTSFNNPVDSAYTADRWKIRVNPAAPTSYTVTQEASIIDQGNFSLKLSVTTVGSALVTLLRQSLENPILYAGKTLTFSARVRTNVAGLIIRISNGVTNSNSTAHTGDGSFQTLTATQTIPASPATIDLDIGWVGVSAGGANVAVSTTYIDSATLVMGNNPATFSPLNPQQDLARCQRYFFRMGGEGGGSINNMHGMGYNFNTTTGQSVVRFPVTMRVFPTATPSSPASTFIVYNGGATTINCTSIVVQNASTNSCGIQYTVASGLVPGGGNVLYGGTSFIDFSADL
jgi:hypothetical protein